jgi:hypothetical protein
LCAGRWFEELLSKVARSNTEFSEGSNTDFSEALPSKFDARSPATRVRAMRRRGEGEEKERRRTGEGEEKERRRREGRRRR